MPAPAAAYPGPDQAVASGPVRARSRADVALEWQSVAFSSGPTGPTERDRAESGIHAAYTAAGLAPPEHFIWVPSPVRGAIAAALLAGHGDVLRQSRPKLTERLGADVEAVTPLIEGAAAGASVREVVRTRPWESARASACSGLGPRGWARAWGETGGRLWAQVDNLVSRVRGAIGDLAGDERGTATLLRGATLDAILGQHDAPWLSLFDSLGHLDTASHPGGSLSSMARVARVAGWWWPYERIVIVSERPVDLDRDESGRLHRGDGPALAYADGFALHAWRGMPIPAGFVESLTDLSPSRIEAETNAEQRRIMLEIYGYDRYLAECGAEPVHRDETGTLWRIVLRRDEPITLVEVVNSTPEPDGSRRTYFLRVPPRTRTAREGVAWTFGLAEDDYYPENET
ncbi:hypothetical protein I6A84_19655 [Frankia sp. CNm7]|nr:hypothetical protein [Frankia nepalensis]MBL7496295.1 hypothetical protein [Frankia nepalensis]MBL7508508.1 hypothetical protein [Frankia nepalensis]MBL7520241.1 hypothetical protein [Frankia nepalensis]